METYKDSVTLFFQYAFKVLPEVRRLTDSLAGMEALCMPKSGSREESGAEAPDPSCASMLCSSLFALYPGVDLKSTLTFILSLYSLAGILGNSCINSGTTDEMEVRRLYGCLAGAVDPSRSTACSSAAAVKTMADQGRKLSALPCLSGQCRLQLAILPSFTLVAPRLRKYIQLYIDLQSYRHYPPLLRTEYLNAWSANYMKRYQEITCWEFCAASDSLLGIAAMYAAAAKPDLTAEEVRILDEACFPWLCGLDSLLGAYVSARNTNHTKCLNFTVFYKNLKACDERLSFFASKAENACLKLKESGFYTSLVKMLIGMYLSDPEADFGMCRLASMNILRNSPPRTMLYSNACKLLQLCRS